MSVWAKLALAADEYSLAGNGAQKLASALILKATLEHLHLNRQNRRCRQLLQRIAADKTHRGGRDACDA